MKYALLTAVALWALTVAQAHAQTAANPPATPPAAGEQHTSGGGGCPCCQKMAMMQPKKDGSSGMQMDHGAPAQPTPNFNR